MSKKSSWLIAHHETTGEEIEVLVSRDDLDFLEQHKWFINRRGYVYRQSSERVPGRKHPKCFNLYLHRVIMGLPRYYGLEVDHLNSQPWDNRRENLQVVCRAVNLDRAQKTLDLGESL